jgi:hypothetical protein
MIWEAQKMQTKMLASLTLIPYLFLQEMVKDLRATVKFKAGKSQVTTQNLRDANTAW